MKSKYQMNGSKDRRLPYNASPRQEVGRLSCSFGRRGSVLFELLLAVLIFGMAALALAQALNQAGKLAIETKQASRIQARAHSLLFEYGFGAELEEGETEIPSGDEGVVYQIVVEPVEVENMDGQVLADMFQVTVNVDWEEGGEQQHFEAGTYRYAPLYR